MGLSYNYRTCSILTMTGLLIRRWLKKVYSCSRRHIQKLVSANDTLNYSNISVAVLLFATLIVLRYFRLASCEQGVALKAPEVILNASFATTSRVLKVALLAAP